MRSLLFDHSLKLDPRRAEPAEEDGDTLLKVRLAGICATDLEIVKGYMNFRGILGHEFVGEVISSPKKNSSASASLGDQLCLRALRFVRVGVEQPLP